jgi:ribosomal 30S subunit maturation factor RimM
MLSRLDSAELPADAIEVGRIADAWGIKGWFKVLPHSASPEALFSSKRWYLQPSERGAKTFSRTVLLRVREAKDHSDTIVACSARHPRPLCRRSPEGRARVRSALQLSNGGH